MPDDDPTHLILATAGHVDHGKTALVKALTGVDTDRLPEEKARGITIELGFAHLALPGFSLGVIDVPGHEDFIRNMIAGLGAIDLALFVVAADDGWMPQTEEHLQILQYLGVRHGVVAITKCDLGDPARVAHEVGERLRGTSLGEMPIVPTSARTSAGLEELKQALQRVCAGVAPPRDSGKPRLFVDRVFTVRGTGTVVTGTLRGGPLTRGEKVSLQPQNLHAHVRAIQSHNRSTEIALPGTRTALNLPELRPDEIPRGSVLTTAITPQSSRTIDALVERSARELQPSRPLKNASVIQVHYGSARCTARILLLDRRELSPGKKTIARLHFTEPVFALIGDHFIIRDSSGRQTIAGATILDCDASGTKFRAPAEREFLTSRAVSPNDLLALLRTQMCRAGVSKRASLLAQSNFSEREVTSAIDQLVSEGAFFASGAMVAEANCWQSLRQRAIDAIDAEHRAHPERTGLAVAQLRADLSLSDPEVEDALLTDLGAHGFPSAQGAIKRQTHRPSLPAPLARAGATIRAALAAKPFDPPSRKELVPDAAAQQALRFLIETGEVILLRDEVLVAADAFARMKKIIAETLRQRGAATVSELRQVLGTSRRVVVPLLERSDRDGLTKREGDRRSLRAAKS